MVLTVWFASWQLEEDLRILSLGEELSCWLTFQERDRWPLPAEQVQVLRGTAVTLPSWPGGEQARQPVRIDVDGAALYWDAPEPVAGLIEVAGRVSSNVVDAPEGFPETRGLVRGLRMEWREVVRDRMSGWRHAEAAARYEQVHATYLPPGEDDDRVVASGGTRWTGVLVDLECAGLG